MGHGDATPDRVALTVLADRYEAIKKEVATGLRARQEASRFGGTPLPDATLPEDGAPSGRQDARRIAARRLGAGVSHTTLEKVLWLRRVAFDMERRASLRQEAMDAWDAVDVGDPVNWPYDRVHTLVLIDDLEQVAAEAPRDTMVKMAADRHLKLLREHGVHAVTAVMKRQARRALADAARMDKTIDEAARSIGPAWPQVEATLKRRRREDMAAYLQAAHERYLALAGIPLCGDANT